MSEQMMQPATLVCEGGSMSGVFTAGVLDTFLRHHISFANGVGVSAGACNLVNFAAGQQGRTFHCMAVKDWKLRYIGLPSLLRSHTFYDYDMCFEAFADHYIPFDYEAFARAPMRTEVVVTNCETGQAVFVPCRAADKQVIRATRASASLPFISKMYPFDGMQCLDGGISCSIPIQRALQYGNRKIVVILTKPPGYRKQPPSRLNEAMIARVYAGNPALQAALRNRYRVYNASMACVEKLARKGAILLYRPETKMVSRHERSMAKLQACYAAGRVAAEQRMPELLQYLASEPQGEAARLST